MVKNLVVPIVIVSLLGLNIAPAALAAGDSGTFRGKWWNYYDRALERAEAGDQAAATEDLRQAISMRKKDQRMARTYGMHFVDYFPHRELGIIHLGTGDIDRAIGELEESLRNEESAKAVFYLNKARKAQLRDRSGGIRPPVITVESLQEGATVRDLAVKVRGRAKGEGLVSRITINGSPVRFELAGRDVPFEQEVQVSDGENSIKVACEDLLGKIAEKTVSVTVDREGPGITVADIRAEERAGEKTVRISGGVSDVTGIDRVIIGQQQVQVDGRREYAFDVDIGRKGAGERVAIKAVDTLGNETEAAVDVAGDLAAFGRRPGPVLLAFNAPGILSFDKEPPVLKLKESGELPVVFVDRYFVEGEAFDNRKVGKILINGKEIWAGQGKKVFFSKMVKLNEGSNRIKVEAVDGSGNKAATEYTIRREVPSVLQVGARLNLTVLPFDSKQKRPEYAELAYDRLIGAFIDQKRFSIVERAKLDQVLQEQKLTKAKLTDPEHSLRIGRLMSANALVSTSVKEDQRSIEIVSRVINTETSEVMDVKDVFSEDTGMATVRELMDGLAAKIAAGFPLIEGMVIKREDGTIYTDLGRKARLHKDAAVIIYRKGREITHPVTGKSLGFDTVKLAEGRIEEIQEDFSKGRILDKPKPQEIRVKDLIVTK